MIPANITTRETSGTGASNKGSPLTNSELDNNFIAINNGLVQLQNLAGYIANSRISTDSAGKVPLDKTNPLGGLVYTGVWGSPFNVGEYAYLDSNYNNTMMVNTNSMNMTVQLDSASWQSGGIYSFLNNNYTGNTMTMNQQVTYLVLLHILNGTSSQVTLTWSSQNTYWKKVFPAGTPPAGPASGQVNSYLLHYVLGNNSPGSGAAGNLDSSANVFIYPVATNLQGVN